MTTEDDIASLLERVKAATGGDRELDVDIAWALEPERYRAAYWNGRVGKPGTTLPHKLDGLGRVSVKSNCPAFTNSIDAALALVERILPGAWWHIAKGRLTSAEPLFGAELLFSDDESLGRGEGQTAPLAILAALLTSLKENHP